MADILGIGRRHKDDKRAFHLLKTGVIPNEYRYGLPVCYLQVLGKVPHTEKGVLTDEYSKRYDKSRYKFMLDAPFKVSDKCCAVMKKKPMHEYQKSTGRHPITAQMACESRLRQQKWLQSGCNAFDGTYPISNPMSFWLEQDVLQYIKQNNIKICSVYGDITYDLGDNIKGQMDITDFIDTDQEPKLKTSGCERTGCMFCGFGCHLEKESRFERMKTTHPKQYDYIMRKENGLNYKEIIDWVNENGGFKIKY